MNKLPGLTGLVTDYLCDGPVHVDEDLALGAAIATVAACVNRSYRLNLPGYTRPVPLIERIFLPVILVGPPLHGGRVLVARADRLLALRCSATATAPVDSAPTKSSRAMLSTWEEGFGWPVRDERYLIVPRSETTHVGDPSLSERELADRLATIRHGSASELVWWDAMAYLAHRNYLDAMREDAAQTGDLNLYRARVRRWTHVCGVLAVGVDHEAPVVTRDIVDIAVCVCMRAHTALLGGVEAAGPGLH